MSVLFSNSPMHLSLLPKLDYAGYKLSYSQVTDSINHSSESFGFTILLKSKCLSNIGQFATASEWEGRGGAEHRRKDTET